MMTLTQCCSWIWRLCLVEAGHLIQKRWECRNAPLRCPSSPVGKAHSPVLANTWLILAFAKLLYTKHEVNNGNHGATAETNCFFSGFYSRYLRSWNTNGHIIVAIQSCRIRWSARKQKAKTWPAQTNPNGWPLVHYSLMISFQVVSCELSRCCAGHFFSWF